MSVEEVLDAVHNKVGCAGWLGLRGRVAEGRATWRALTASAAPTHRRGAPPQVVNLTVLAIESERPDPRLEAWLGGAFAYFFQDLETNSSAGSGGRPSNFSTADVHAAVSDLDFCPLAAGNVLNITVRALWLRRARHRPEGQLASTQRRRRRMHGLPCARAGAPAGHCTVPQTPAPCRHSRELPPPLQARLDEETLFEGAPVRADFPPGVVVEVLVGHVGELEARGHTPQLSAHLADSGPGPDGATGTC